MNPPLFVNPTEGKPTTSWWVEPVEGSFTARCCDELPRMRQSKEHHRLGLPLVIGQIDGKQARTS